MDGRPKANAAEPGAGAIPPMPSRGRVFVTQRRVSIADADPERRMELDAVARFLQDAGNDDTDDAELPELGLAWVARRAAIEVHQPAASRELLTLTTWCSGTGSRWAERRTAITGDGGARLDAAVIWVHLDATTGRPMKWGTEFADRYLEATGGRQVDAKLRHAKETPDNAASIPWTFRATDMDAFGHVNNAAYLAIAEEAIDLGQKPCRIEAEWRGPSVAGEALTVHSAVDGDVTSIWVRAGNNDDDDLRVTITHRPLADSPPITD